MKPLKSTRISTVAVTQVVATPSEELQPLRVTAALWDMKSNDIVAIMEEGVGWSPETLAALSKLYECIENDIAAHMTRGTDEKEEEEGTDATGTGGGIFPQEER